MGCTPDKCGDASRSTERDDMEARKFDSGKPKLSLLPYDALLSVAEVLLFGAEKYGRHNWSKGKEWSRYEDAMLRHYASYHRGEDIDPESGLPHLAHMSCCALFLLAYYLRRTPKDDRQPY